MVRNLLALTGLAAIALLAAVTIRAYGWLEDDGLPPPRLGVSYVGLDLATPQGVALLEDRINVAIAEVCPSEAGGTLRQQRAERLCRRRAIAMVEPQVARAVAAAEAQARPAPPPPPSPLPVAPAPTYEDDDSAAADRMLPPYPAVQPPIVQRPLGQTPAARERRLVRRITTTTVTTTRTGPAAIARPATQTRRPMARPAPVRRSTAYARLPDRPGSWLPPAAWRAVERANARAFATGRLTRWASPGRSGYVTISPARRVRGLTCRNLRVVKQHGARQLVVAEGTRCRLPDGRIVARHCP